MLNLHQYILLIHQLFFRHCQDLILIHNFFILIITNTIYYITHYYKSPFFIIILIISYCLFITSISMYFIIVYQLFLKYTNRKKSKNLDFFIYCIIILFSIIVCHNSFYISYHCHMVYYSRYIFLHFSSFQPTSLNFKQLKCTKIHAKNDEIFNFSI